MESSDKLSIDWTVSNTIGLEGTIAEGRTDDQLTDSLQVLRGTVYWRSKNKGGRATPPDA